MKVVAFNGSPRQDGNTTILIKHVFAELINEGIQTELIQLSGNKIASCIACYKCFEKKDKLCILENDNLNQYIKKIMNAEGIIMGSPTYFLNMTSDMKAFIDRVGFVARANEGLFDRKVAAAVSVARRVGSSSVLDSFNTFFLASGMIVPGSNYPNMAIGREKGEVERDTEGIQTMHVLGKNMAWLLKKLYE